MFASWNETILETIGLIVKRFRQRLLPVLFLFIVFGHASVADACPNCKNALELSRAFAFGASVLFLMSMPFTIGAIWCIAMIRFSKAADWQDDEPIIVER